MSTQPSSSPQGLISVFAKHPVAANLLMVLMLLAGIWGLKKLNTQFFPTFSLDIIAVGVAWSGASAEDVERSIVLPTEEALRAINGIKSIYATSYQGRGGFRLELQDGADVPTVLDQVKQRMASLREKLPAEADEPVVQKVLMYEQIASVLITSPQANLDELRNLAHRYEQELLDLGIRRVTVLGMPKQQYAIKIPSAELHSLGMSLNDIASNIRQRSQDIPSGTAARDDGARQIRSLNQQRSIEGFKRLPIIANDKGQLVTLGDVADINLESRNGAVELFYQDQPAILLTLERTERDNTLQAAKIFEDWKLKTEASLPQGMKLISFDESWTALEGRINLLLKNGLGGLILVIAVLFLFLNARVAFWVTVGIPVSFMATLAVLYLIDGSINMISLFGLIMALGIIVDDAIVVGEDTLSHFKQGENSLSAAIGGANRMLSPVLASSMTTIAAFLPLMMIGGIMGSILVAIPAVIICVILASLIECFFILPGHLYHSLKHQVGAQPSRIRQKLDLIFEHFKENIFRSMVRRAVEFRWATIATAIGVFIIAIGLMAGGRVKFTFFPPTALEIFTANVKFTAGTDVAAVPNFLNHLENSLYATEKSFKQNLIKVAFQEQGTANFPNTSASETGGDVYGSLVVELVAFDKREVSNEVFIKQWRKLIDIPPGVERFSIDQNTAGPGGKPIEIQLTGAEVATLKAASYDIQVALKEFSGLSNIEDDLPYGEAQYIYHLTPEAAASGIKAYQVARQIRSSLDGLEIQSFYRGKDEIEVRVMLPDSERNQLAALESIPILLSNGEHVPLGSIVEFTPQRGLDVLKRVDGYHYVNVSADLDTNVTNANSVIDTLKTEKLPPILEKYRINASFEGKNKSQRDTLSDIKFGLFVALALIYIILSWVFASYSWPFTVMLAIPLGLTGAILGHYISGMDLTIMSLFGFFGLSGIVINDSIVLVTFYKKLRSQGYEVKKAIEEAACQRLRAVLLTSLTTIAGLTPILFETSLQAQFLIPMATSIVFGLAYGTLLILLFIPAALSVLEERTNR